jgi:Leucine-rich repeat (LRR) protein
LTRSTEIHLILSDEKLIFLFLTIQDQSSTNKMTNSIVYQTADGTVHTVYYDAHSSEINLFQKEITKIIQINGLSNLQTLILSRNLIKKIEGFDHLYALRKLNLYGNQIKHIEGLEQLSGLQCLELGFNKIKKIEGLDRLINLQELSLRGNLIERMEGLDHLTNLQDIDLFFNQIRRIEGIDLLTNLQKLYLAHNLIERMEGMDRLISLQILRLDCNRIKKIEGIDHMIALQELVLLGNLIERIEGIGLLTNLQTLVLNYNVIERIEGFDQLTNLQNLHLDNNQIERIEGLDRLTNLKELYLHYNQIDIVPLNIMNLRNLTCFRIDVSIPINPVIERFLTKNLIKTNQTIYDDPQNVHDSQINQSIANSLYSLMEQKSELSDENVISEILGDSILTERVKQQIVEYSKSNDVHSKLNVTFMEALQIVWQIIRSHDQSDCIKKILNQEMQDSICMCFTGRLSRLINCLNGFDPRVRIKISDNQEIANLIIRIRQKYNNLDQQIKMAQKELTDRGYSEQTIDEWIGYLE